MERNWNGLVSLGRAVSHSAAESQLLTLFLVIVLIAAEIIVAAINIFVDMYWVD